MLPSWTTPPTIFNDFDDPGKGLYASPPTRVSIPHFNKHQYSVKYIISGAERGEFGLFLFISSMSLSKSLDFPNSGDFKKYAYAPEALKISYHSSLWGMYSCLVPHGYP